MYSNTESLHKQAVKAQKVRQMNNVQEVTCIGVVIEVNVGTGIMDIEQLSKGEWKIDCIKKDLEDNIVISLYPEQ